MFGARYAVKLPSAIAAAFVVAMGVSFAASAQQASLQAPPPARLLLTPSNPLPKDGAYIANDKIGFSIDHQGGQVRMRFLDNDEVFYLTSEAAPMGGRVLKYDTGAVALQVTGWGGLTLYTAAAKGGLPAEFVDVPMSVDPPPVAAKDMKSFAAKLAQDLSSGNDFAIGFAADWDRIAQSDTLRALICDAMRNATYALEEIAKGSKRGVVADRLHIVRVLQGAKPGVSVQKGILAVTIAPQQGAGARPSSLAVMRALQGTL
jgi:hypothetical protein